MDEVISMQNSGKSKDEITQELSKKGFSNQQIADAFEQANIKAGVQGQIPSITPPEVGTNFQENLNMPKEMKPSILQPESEEDIPIPVPSPTENSKKESQDGTSEPNPINPSSIQSIEGNNFQQPKINNYVPSNQSSQGIDMETIQELVESVIDERWQEVVASVGDISLWKSKVEDDIAAIKQEILRVGDRVTQLQSSIIGKVNEYQQSISNIGNEMVALEKVFSKIMEPLTSNIKELQRITESLKKEKINSK